ncbi:MAG: molybdopterin converting factor subunit 1 [Cytophagales bacterium]|nr:molybdopterin converting factor subunit 1 [Cytophagales bacterium]
MTVKYFASIREAVGVSSETITCPANTVGVLRDFLIAKGAPYAEVLARGKSVRSALNQVMCDESTELANGCEVAFFPPVTGG